MSQLKDSTPIIGKLIKLSIFASGAVVVHGQIMNRKSRQPINSIKERDITSDNVGSLLKNNAKRYILGLKN